MSRPRKPTALKLVTGTDRADRANGNEPEPQLLNDLTPPSHLSERSAAVWREVAPMLRRIQVLTEADVISLEMLCDAVADYRLARETRGESFPRRRHFLLERRRQEVARGGIQQRGIVGKSRSGHVGERSGNATPGRSQTPGPIGPAAHARPARTASAH